MMSVEGETADEYMGRVFRAIELMLEQKTAHPVEENGASAFEPGER